MIKVLHVLSSGLVGGTERMTVRLIKGMDRNRFENHVAFFRGDGPIGDDLRALGVRATVIDFSPRHFLRATSRFARLLRTERFDIVQIYGLRANFLVRPVAWLLKVPALITAQRSVDLDRKPWHSMIDRLTSFMVNLYLSNSQAAADLLTTRERIPVEKVRTVHNGVDCARIEAYAGERDSVRQELGIAPEEICLGVVARLEPPKGLDTFLTALALLPPSLSVKAVIVGDGSLKDALLRQASGLGLVPNRVMFSGLRHDVPRLLSGFDLFILPSLWEGLPGAVMEAMCAALPVIASRVGGVPELIVPGETGLLVEPGDPRELALAITSVLSDARLRGHMGDAGRTRIVNDFSVEKMISQTELIYTSIVESNTRPS